MSRLLMVGFLYCGLLSPAFSETTIKLNITIDDSVVENKKTEKKQAYTKYKSEKKLLAAYADAWSKNDYDFMYHLLSEETREEWSFKKFRRLLKNDKVTNGGLKEFSSHKQLSNNGSVTDWAITLNYKFDSARNKTIRTTLEKVNGEFWNIKSGGLLPPDLSMFDQ